MQIIGSQGLVDLRDVVVVRRARANSNSEGQDRIVPNGAHGEEDGWESLSEDEEDEGGSEGLQNKAAAERQKRKRGRSFELVLANGDVQVLEASSSSSDGFRNGPDPPAIRSHRHTRDSLLGNGSNVCAHLPRIFQRLALADITLPQLELLRVYWQRKHTLE